MAVEALAILDGAPVRARPWPLWPRPAPRTRAYLEEVLASGRWTNSGPYTGHPLFERRFARAFAEYCGAAYCVPTDHGSSALSAGLEALDIGAQDEVIVPALTWVATATAVTHVNAIPVFVDVDPKTLCIDVGAAERAITPRTKAILPVHLYSQVADMDALLDLGRRAGVPIFEDCAHVHGAAWRGRRVGSLGVMGAFSLQQSKVLTAGEGGAVVTSDPALARRLEQLRADSRLYTDAPLARYDMELVTAGEVQGTNHCLSELAAAVLLAQLEVLDAEHARREAQAAALDARLEAVEGVAPLGCAPEVTRRVFYCYVVRIDRSAFAGRSAAAVGAAVTRELGAPVFTTYPPLPRVASYRPASKRRFQLSPAHVEALTVPRFDLPVAARAHAEHLCLPHWVLLGDDADVGDIARAFDKVRRLAEALPEEH